MVEVTVLPGAVRIQARDGETVLGAAMRSGFHYRFGCKRGGCGVCKVRLILGEVRYERPVAASVLPDDERTAGVCLIYLAHESQLPTNGDYLTTWIGRQPVIVSRTRTGDLAAVVNACAHRGAMVCRRKKDNRSTWTCPFHGWTYRNDGTLLKAKDAKGAGATRSSSTPAAPTT